MFSISDYESVVLGPVGVRDTSFVFLLYVERRNIVLNIFNILLNLFPWYNGVTQGFSIKGSRVVF
jgi:hypothetical protein